MFNWFYDKSFFTTKVIEQKVLMQLQKLYIKDKEFDCDIQPIDEKAIKYTFGNDIKSRLQMFSNENLEVNDIIIYNNKSYSIEKKIQWDDYFIYAILESDVIVDD